MREQSMCKAINVRHSGLNSFISTGLQLISTQSLQDKITDHALMVDYYMSQQHFILNSYSRRQVQFSIQDKDFKISQVNAYLSSCIRCSQSSCKRCEASFISIIFRSCSRSWSFLKWTICSSETIWFIAEIPWTKITKTKLTFFVKYNCSSWLIQTDLLLFLWLLIHVLFFLNFSKLYLIDPPVGCIRITK